MNKDCLYSNMDNPRNVLKEHHVIKWFKYKFTVVIMDMTVEQTINKSQELI